MLFRYHGDGRWKWWKLLIINDTICFIVKQLCGVAHVLLVSVWLFFWVSAVLLPPINMPLGELEILNRHLFCYIKTLPQSLQPESPGFFFSFYALFLLPHSP